MPYYENVQKKAPGRVIEDHRCRTCGRPAILSDDHGRTWFCSADAPKDFWPHMRVKTTSTAGSQRAPAPPSPSATTAPAMMAPPDFDF